MATKILRINTRISRVCVGIAILLTLAIGCSDTKDKEPPKQTTEGEEEKEVETPAGNITIESVELSSESLTIGEPLIVEISLRNDGVRSNFIELNLKLDDQIVLTQNHAVPGGLQDDKTVLSHPIELSWIPTTAGNFTIAINEYQGSQIEVKEITGSIKVENVSVVNTEAVHNSQVHVGETIVFEVALEGMYTNRYTTEVMLHDREDVIIDRADVSFAPANQPTTQTVLLEWTPEQAGSYELSVNDFEIGEFLAFEKPTVRIELDDLNPKGFLVANKKDATIGWYADIGMLAEARDAIDGDLTGNAIVWSTLTSPTGGSLAEPKKIGKGDIIHTRLFMAPAATCGKMTDHLIRIEATNSAGLTTTHHERITMMMGSC